MIWFFPDTPEPMPQPASDQHHQSPSSSKMQHMMDLPPAPPPDAFILDDDDACLPQAVADRLAGTAADTAQPTQLHNSNAAVQHGTTPQAATATAAQQQQAPGKDRSTAAAGSGSGPTTGHVEPRSDPAASSQQQQQAGAATNPHQAPASPPCDAAAQKPSARGGPVTRQHHDNTTDPRALQQQQQEGGGTSPSSPQQQQQQQQGHRQQPRDLATLLSQLCDNAEAIAAAEEVLSGLLSCQTSLHQLGRKMEQQQVLAVLQRGHMGYDRGRPVAAVLLYRCLQHWGLLHQTEPCAFLEQLSGLLQDQLDLDDASAPAAVAGLQCHVADSLTLCAVLYCVLLKATHPELAAAAAAEHGKAPKQLHSAAEVVAAARKRMSATWQQGVAHMGPGLQALGKLKIGGWGFKRSEEPAAAAAAGGGGSRSSSTSSSQAPQQSTATAGELHDAPHASSTPTQQQQQLDAAATAGQDVPGAASSAAVATPAPAAAPAAAEVLHAAAPLGAFLLCLDLLVQHAYILLRDQLKRRLTPLLADCVSPENSTAAAAEDIEADSAGAGNGIPGADPQQQQQQRRQPASPTSAGAAVAGRAAESAAHAEAALMNYRSWSELVGVLHAALVALRAAHVPRALRASLMQQVLEFVNGQLFNQLLLRPECCSVSNARYALRGLKQLDTWIVAEQSAAQQHQQHHGVGAAGRVPHSMTAAGSIHSSFNSQTPPPPAAAAAAGGGGGEASADSKADSGAAAAPVAAVGSSAGVAAEAKQPEATAAAAAADEEDAGWEQVPADAGDFDTWHPHKQQQQQWWRPQKQQQQQVGAGPAEQPELGPEAWNALAHVRQALQFLVFDSKGALSLEDLTDHVCPALNHQQLYRLCTTAWSEADMTDTGSGGAGGGGGGGVSGEVLEQMKQLYTLSSNGGLIVTFLLDEPTGPLPFVQQQPPAAGTAAAAAGSSSSAGSSGAARCRPSAVVSWDDGRDYGLGLRPVPEALVDEGCPREVFEFLTRHQPGWSPGVRHG